MKNFTAYGLNARNIRKQTFVTPLFVKPEDVELGIFEKTDGYLVTVFKHGENPDFMFLDRMLSIDINNRRRLFLIQME